jgi:hypothetical protein
MNTMEPSIVNAFVNEIQTHVFLMCPSPADCTSSVLVRIVETGKLLKMAEDRPDDGGSKDLWNVGTTLPDYTMLQPRRQPSSYSSPWKPQILLRKAVLYVRPICSCVSVNVDGSAISRSHGLEGYQMLAKTKCCLDGVVVGVCCASRLNVRSYVLTLLCCICAGCGVLHQICPSQE